MSPISAAVESEQPQTRTRISSARIILPILAVPLFIGVFDNQQFIGQVLESTRTDTHRFAIAATMFLLVLVPLIIVSALAAGKYLFKTVASILLIAAAGCAYFMNNYGVVIDTSMIRNVMETDAREAGPLLTAGFLMHIGVFGVAPAIGLWFWRLPDSGWRQQLLIRGAVVAISLLALGGVLYANYGAVSFFGHQNHALRMQINPGYPLYSSIRFLTRADDQPPDVRKPLDAEVARAHLSASKPTLLVFVMGETARADRFSLNGYGRLTNRYTANYDIVNFPDVTSCGTSTADSLPCIFSPFDRAGFTHARFAQHESLLQTLERLGIHVQWKDNSTGCKNICEEAYFEQMVDDVNPAFCEDAGCYDEILLSNLSLQPNEYRQDEFAVLHQRGSHGPAYFTDSPQWSKEYFPECDKANLRNCSVEEINNAYDNTILYTDYFLSRVIDWLQQRTGEFNTAMIYVSDHGESLGEKGLFLHGLPYSIAPEAQTHVPMLFWASEGFYRAQRIDPDCLREQALKPITHAAIFHTLLPLYGIRASAYDSELDFLSPCRSDAARDSFGMVSDR